MYITPSEYTCSVLYTYIMYCVTMFLYFFFQVTVYSVPIPHHEWWWHLPFASDPWAFSYLKSSMDDVISSSLDILSMVHHWSPLEWDFDKDICNCVSHALNCTLVDIDGSDFLFSSGCWLMTWTCIMYNEFTHLVEVSIISNEWRDLTVRVTYGCYHFM